MSNQNLKYTLSLQDLFTGKMNAAIKQTQKMDGLMSSLKGTIASLGIGVGISEIVKIGSEFERAEIQLKTLLKSSTEAKRVFNDLRKESETSPFGFDTLLKGNAALISTGISAKQAKEDFNSLANAIAATGGGEDELNRMVFNLQQIKNVGATAADIKQFGMAGINIYGLLDNYAEKYNVTIDRQHITYEQIIESLKLAGKEGGQYYGALANLANSTSGKLSNLYDAFKNLAYEIFNSLKPAIGLVVQSVTVLFNLFKKFLPLIKSIIILWGSYYVKTKLATWQTTQFALAQRAMAMGMSKSAIAAGFLKRGIDGIKTALKSIPIIGWIMALVDAFMYLWDTFEGFRAFFYGMWDGIKVLFDQIGLKIKGLWHQLQGLMSGDVQLISIGIKESALADAMGALAEKKGQQRGIASFRGQNGTDASTISDMAGGGAAGLESSNKKGSLGSGSEVSGARPQNLNINIEKLVETLEIKANNVTESVTKMKEMVTQALLESVNDLNMITR